MENRSKYQTKIFRSKNRKGAIRLAKLNVEKLADNAVKFDGDVYVKTTGKPKVGNLVRACDSDISIDKGSFYQAVSIDSDGDPHFLDNDNDRNWLRPHDTFAKLSVGTRVKIMGNSENTTVPFGDTHRFSIGDIREVVELRTHGVKLPGSCASVGFGDFEIFDDDKSSTQSFEDGASYTYEGKSYTLRKRMPRDGELVIITEDSDSYYGKVTTPVNIDNSDDSIRDDNDNWYYVEEGEFLTLEDADAKQPKSYNDGDTYEYEGKLYVLRDVDADQNDKVLIVNIYPSESRYNNGDVLSVIGLGEDGDVYDTDGRLVVREEYLVLEPIASESPTSSHTFTVRLKNGRELTITDETAENVADLIAASVDDGDFVHAQLFTSLENIDTIATKAGD
jgi:hypothetical protein